MERRNVFIALAISFLLIVLAVVGYTWWRDEGGIGSSNALVSFRTPSNHPINVSCEVASTTEQWGKGLSDRNSLANGSGMLFVFPTTRDVSFWMKGTLIPLDIVFIDENKSVIGVSKAPTQPGASDSQLVRYTAGGVRWVMETNIGFCDVHGIANGTSLDIIYL